MAVSPPLRRPADLFAQRLAVRALDLALEDIGITGAATTLRWNADDASQVFLLPDGEVRLGHFVERWDQPWVTVTFANDFSTARVQVERVRRLIRSSHLRDFSESAHGIYPEPGAPDLDVQVDLAGLLEREGELLRTAPVRPPDARRRHRHFSSHRSS